MQLYKIIIVDDEPIILKGLVETFDWRGMGFEIAGAAKNGLEALDVIAETRPDVLVTDILMKKLDGLELISRCQELYPDMHYVVISAYREFDYAMRACTLGVFSYLLKPLDEAQIGETMCNLHDVIEQERAGREQLFSYQRIFEEHRHAVEARALQQFIVHNEGAAALEQRLRLVGSTIAGSDRFMAACLDINASDRILKRIDIGTQRFALSSVLLEKLGESNACWCFELADGRLVLVVREREGGFALPAVQSCLAYAEAVLQLRITASLAAAGQGYEGLRQSCQQALRAFELGSETGANIIAAGPDGAQHDGAWYPANLENDVMHAIRLNDMEGAADAFASFSVAPGADGESGRPQLCCHRLALAVLFFLKETYGLTPQVEKILMSYLGTVHTLTVGEARSVLRQAIAEVVAARCACSKTLPDTQADRYIAESLRYIDNHLCDESLSISDVSGHLHLNAVYFGRLFKTRTGMSFKEVVQQRRIERAMKLLDTTHNSIIEVAQAVGIQNPSYFAQLFRQQTGVLPSNYKRNTNA